MIKFKLKNAGNILIPIFLLLFFVGYFRGFSLLAAFVPKAVIYIALLIIWVVLMREYIIKGIRSFKKEYINDALSAAVIMLAASGAVSLIASRLGSDMLENGSPSDAPLLLMLFSSLIYAPVVEELINRGALFLILEKWIRNTLAINILCAALFSFMHLFKMQADPAALFLFGLIYFMLGFVCGRFYLKTNNIILAVLIHFLWNLFTVAGYVLRTVI